MTVARYSQPFQGVDVGDIAAPAGVDRGRIGAEVALHQVRAGCRGRVGDRGGTPPARAPAVQPCGAHQPGDAFTAVRMPGGGQLGMHLRRPVGAPRCRVHRGDLLGQGLIDALPLALLALAVLIVGGPGDLQQLAHTLDVAPAGLLRLDERIHGWTSWPTVPGPPACLVSA